MKHTRKILVALLVFVTLLMSMTAIVASAADEAAPADTYTIAGSEGIFGSNWSNNDANNDMALVDGVYTKVYTNVKAGAYEFKVVKNHTWGAGNEFPSSNYKFAVAEDGSMVTITLNPTDGAVNCVVNDVSGDCTFKDGKFYLIAGAEGLTGAEWSLEAYSNILRCTADGKYYIAYSNVPKGSYDLKVIQNPSSTWWDVQWGTVDAEGKTQNFTINVDSDYSTVVVNFDPNSDTPITYTTNVNTLAVGDTNKILVSGNTLNDYNLPIEWVPFVADENANYTFLGDKGALSFIFKADGTLVSATGSANLEAGNYLICLGNGAVGEFNVAVTKAAWNNTLAIGDNKVLITAIDNGAGYYIAWAPFTVTEKANYTFTDDSILALVFDSAYQAVAGTELDVGTYNICVAFLTPATTGIANVKVEKTPLSDAPVVEEPTLVLGDNSVTIDGSETNLTGNAVAWYTFTPAEDGTYKFSCPDLTVFILKSKNMADLNEYVGADGVAELKADTKYYVLVGKDGVKGDFTVKVETGAAPVHKNTIVVGDNHYIISDALLNTGYEFLLIEITEGGIYKFTGGAPMTVFVFHDAYVGEALNTTAPYTDNVHDITYDYVDYFYVDLPAPGLYWVGFRYDYVGDLREFDINVSLHTEHTFEEGKCTECGETDPNYVAPTPEPEPELDFFQTVLKAITDFFAKIGNFFSDIFGKVGGFFSGLFGGNK